MVTPCLDKAAMSDDGSKGLSSIYIHDVYDTPFNIDNSNIKLQKSSFY